MRFERASAEVLDFGFYIIFVLFCLGLFEVEPCFIFYRLAWYLMAKSC